MWRQDVMEIEQKFLINKIPDSLESFSCKDIVQGYLSFSPVVRIRKSNDRYILTYKSKPKDKKDISGVCINNELEAFLDEESFNHLAKKCDGLLIYKKRYIIPLSSEETHVEGLKVEMDVFEGILKGLVFGEVEFPDEGSVDKFIKPDWIGDNVSDDIRFKNNFLATITSREKYLELFK